MYKYLSIVVASGLITGCFGGNNIKDPMAFDKRPLVKASIMPTKAQLNGAKTRVIVFGIDDKDVSLARRAKLGAAISNKIETILADTGVELVDRNLAKKLQKEISLAELKGNSDYKGPEVADFSITGKIISTNFSQKYTAASSWVDTKKVVHRVPARCKYTVQLEGSLKVHALPALRMVDTITIKDIESQTQDLTGSSYYQYYRNKSCPTYNSTQISSLASAAAIDAINSSKNNLKNNFSPRGYVTEYRAKEDKHIIKITIGKKAGVKEGQEVQILQSFTNEDQLTGRSNIEERVLVKGAVSNQVGNNYAWIVVDDPKKANRIRLGDTVKVRYASGWW